LYLVFLSLSCLVQYPIFYLSNFNRSLFRLFIFLNNS
jgi:hypothetical protein